MEKQCEGDYIFSYRVNTYLSKHKTVEQRKTLTPLKSFMCCKCERCKSVLDFISEDVICREDDFFDNYGIKIGGRYRLIFKGDIYEPEAVFIRIKFTDPEYHL